MSRDLDRIPSNAGPLHRRVEQTYEEKATVVARAHGMIARAYVRHAVGQGRPLSPESARNLRDAIDFLQEALAIAESNTLSAL